MTTPKAKRKKNWMGKPRQVSLTIGVYPEELSKWKAEAKREDRSLSQWIRLHLARIHGAAESITGSVAPAPEPRSEQQG